MEHKEELKGLGQVIRALRELKDMSRGDLAEAAGLGVDMVAKVEQGAKRPSTGALKRIGQALDVDAVELSARGLQWAGLRTAGEASTGLLQQVATGSPWRAVTGAAAMGAAARALITPLTPVGLASVPLAAAALQASRQRDRRAMENVLRAALEDRLSQARTEEDLRRIAKALDSAAEAGTAPSRS